MVIGFFLVFNSVFAQDVCGDGLCTGDETVFTCSVDCDGVPFCGDLLCTNGETPDTCPLDCFSMNYCGDRFCDGEETLDSCAADCSVCGDGYCTGPEDNFSCNMDCPGVYRAFVTSKTFDANFGSLAKADAQCMNAAGRFGSSRWKAYLGTATQTPVSRLFPSTIPYSLMDGLLGGNWIAFDHAYLAAGTLLMPLDRDEFFEPQTGYAWTGTMFSSTRWGPKETCLDWTVNSGYFNNGSGGQVSDWRLNPPGQQEGWRWNTGAFMDCGMKNHLYCFEQPWFVTFCGDGICNEDENAQVCPEDCAAPSALLAENCWKFDARSDGAVTASDLSVIADCRIQRASSVDDIRCERFDLDGDGTIGLDEFVRANACVAPANHRIINNSASGMDAVRQLRAIEQSVLGEPVVDPFNLNAKQQARLSAALDASANPFPLAKSIVSSRGTAPCVATVPSGKLPSSKSFPCVPQPVLSRPLVPALASEGVRAALRTLLQSDVPFQQKIDLAVKQASAPMAQPVQASNAIKAVSSVAVRGR